MKLRSSIVLKEVNPDLIYALSLEHELEEFFKFEAVSARILKFMSTTPEFTAADVCDFVISQYPDVTASQALEDVTKLCEFLSENRFIS